jgi:flavin-dependent dehydrogenase
VSSSHEVVILGGGPAGCAAALTLARAGVARVLVIEASHYEHERVGESIPPDARRLFDQLGLLDAFMAERHEPCLGSCSAWGSEARGYNDFMFNPYGHGWHLDRRRFDAFLAARVEAAGVELRRGIKFLDVVEDGHARTLSLGDAQGESARVQAEFVIDATGQRSIYAKRMGARPRELDRLVAVAGSFELPDDDGDRLFKLTLLEAVEQGWWYTARLPDRRVAVAVATSHELYKQLRLDREPTWHEALGQTRHVSERLRRAGATPIEGSLAVHLAPSFLLDQMHGQHWLAIGDAASSYDPISSQGIYKALADGIAGGRALVEALGGRREALGEYAEQVERRFTEYAKQRGYFYEQEQRWADAPFWSERRAARELPSTARRTG